MKFALFLICFVPLILASAVNCNQRSEGNNGLLEINANPCAHGRVCEINCRVLGYCNKLAYFSVDGTNLRASPNPIEFNAYYHACARSIYSSRTDAFTTSLIRVAKQIKATYWTQGGDIAIENQGPCSWSQGKWQVANPSICSLPNRVLISLYNYAAFVRQFQEACQNIPNWRQDIQKALHVYLNAKPGSPVYTGLHPAKDEVPVGVTPELLRIYWKARKELESIVLAMARTGKKNHCECEAINRFYQDVQRGPQMWQNFAGIQNYNIAMTNFANRQAHMRAYCHQKCSRRAVVTLEELDEIFE